MPDFLIPILHWLESSKYFLLFFAGFFEGPIATLTAGFLVRTGQLDLFPAYLILVTADFLEDLCWYGVGYWGANPLILKYGHYIGISPELVIQIESRFKKHQDKILFISKLTMGFGFAIATLIVAGILRVDFKKYAFLELTGGLIWIAFLLTIGYVFGNVYTLLEGPARVVFIIASLILISLILHQVGKQLKKVKI